MRIVVAAALVGLGYPIVCQAMANALRKGSPALAYALAPWDGRSEAAFSQRLLADLGQGDPSGRSEELARDALRHDATAVEAVVTSAAWAEVHARRPSARRMFLYAQMLSRRDLPTQIWLIEDAVGRGDVAGAVNHYDIALRTSSSAPDLMFPVLAVAVTGAPVRTAVARTLSHRPRWSDAFLSYLSLSGPDPLAASLTFREVLAHGGSVPPQAMTTVIDKLLARNRQADAWELYAAVRPGVSRDRARDPLFTAGVAPPTAFDWVAVEGGGVFGSIERTASGGAFAFEVPAETGGRLLAQAQVLPVGTYLLRGRGTLSQQAGAGPYWLLTCRDGRALGRVEAFTSRPDGGFSGRLSVPPGCPAQILALVAPPDGDQALTGHISEVRLERAP